MLAYRLRTLLILFLAIALPALPARADDASVYQQKATAAYGLGEYKEAAENFERAYKLHPDPALLYNAAQAHRLGGDKERALTLYENYLHVYGTRDSRADEVQRHINDLKAAIAHEKTAATTPPPVSSPVNAAAPPAPPPTPTVPPPAPTAGPPTTTAPAPMVPPPLTAAPPPAATPQPVLVGQPAPATTDQGPATHRTWVWVAIGGAVVVAAAAAIFLASRGSTKDPTASLGTVNGFPQ